MQAEGSALIEDGIPNGPGILDGIHIAVALPETVGGVQFLACGSAVLLQRIFHKLVVLALTHPTCHVDHRGHLVVNQGVLACALVVVDTVGHHVPEGKGPAASVRVTDDSARLHDDPVLGAQIAVCVVDVFRPLFHSLVLAPPGNVAARAVILLAQAVQKIEESVIGLIHFIKVSRSDRFRISAPHGGIIAVCPAAGPAGRITVKHLLLLLVGDPALRLELVSGSYPAFVVTGGRVVGVDAILHGRSRHKLGCVRAFAVVADSLGVVPGNIAAALVGGPGISVSAFAPNHIEGCANNMPGAVVAVIEVSDNALGKFQQSEAKEGPFRVGGPCHIRGAGLFPSRAARVISPDAPGGGNSGRGPLDRLRTEHRQRHAGVGAVGPADGIGQVVAEVTQAVGLILRPGVVLLIGGPVQAVTVQLATLGPADAHGLAGLSDHQRVAAAHSLFLELCQLFSQGIAGRNNMFKSGQPGVELPAAAPVIGDAGENIGQID